jgi:putative phosphoesterase
MRIGVIADTHGYVDPRAMPVFEGVDAIVHAGDVGGMHVLEELERIAPVYAVRGNNDDKIGGLGLPLHADFTLAGVTFHLVHQLPHARPAPDTRVLVFGHSHRVVSEWRSGVLYLNPGAAGRAGFHSTQTVSLIEVNDGSVAPRIVELGPREVLTRARGARARTRRR